jgi:hypothetical protein
MRSRPPWIFSTATKSALRRGESTRAPASARHNGVEERPGPLQEVALLEAQEVGRGIIEPVGVIDAQPRHQALAQPVEDEPVRLGEHLRVLHPDGGQAVDVEEAAVVDLLPRHAPLGQPVAAGLQDRVQLIEGMRLSGLAVEGLHVRGDVRRHLRARGAQVGQAPFDDLLLAVALDDPGRERLGALGQVADGGEDGVQLDEVRSVRAHPGLQRLQSPLEDARVLARGHGQQPLVVVEDERPLTEAQLQLALLEHHPVLIPEHRQQDLARQLVLHGMPVDVEEARVHGRGPVLEHVEPQGVEGIDAHVVGHHVEHLPEPVLTQRGAQGRVLRAGAHLGVELLVVDAVVAVRAARARLEVGRTIEVRHTQAGQVGHHLPGILEGEALVQLHPVGGQRGAPLQQCRPDPRVQLSRQRIDSRLGCFLPRPCCPIQSHGAQS